MNRSSILLPTKVSRIGTVLILWRPPVLTLRARSPARSRRGRPRGRRSPTRSPPFLGFLHLHHRRRSRRNLLRTPGSNLLRTPGSIRLVTPSPGFVTQTPGSIPLRTQPPGSIRDTGCFSDTMPGVDTTIPGFSSSRLMNPGRPRCWKIEPLRGATSADERGGDSELGGTPFQGVPPKRAHHRVLTATVTSATASEPPSAPSATSPPPPAGPEPCRAAPAVQRQLQKSLLLLRDRPGALLHPFIPLQQQLGVGELPLPQERSAELRRGVEPAPDVGISSSRMARASRKSGTASGQPLASRSDWPAPPSSVASRSCLRPSLTFSPSPARRAAWRSRRGPAEH